MHLSVIQINTSCYFLHYILYWLRFIELRKFLQHSLSVALLSTCVSETRRSLCIDISCVWIPALTSPFLTWYKQTRLQGFREFLKSVLINLTWLKVLSTAALECGSDTAHPTTFMRLGYLGWLFAFLFPSSFFRNCCILLNTGIPFLKFNA